LTRDKAYAKFVAVNREINTRTQSHSNTFEIIRKSMKRKTDFTHIFTIVAIGRKFKRRMDAKLCRQMLALDARRLPNLGFAESLNYRNLAEAASLFNSQDVQPNFCPEARAPRVKRSSISCE